jgi:hypothetical protein
VLGWVVFIVDSLDDTVVRVLWLYSVDGDCFHGPIRIFFAFAVTWR